MSVKKWNYVNGYLDGVDDRNIVREISGVEITLERSNGQYQLGLLDLFFDLGACDASDINLNSIY